MRLPTAFQSIFDVVMNILLAVRSENSVRAIATAIV